MADTTEINPDASTEQTDLEILDSPATEELEDKKDGDKAATEDSEETEELEDTKDTTDEETIEEELPETKLRPSIKTIIQKVPEAEKVFKAYPQLRDAYFREGQFSQLFPTIDDAKDAAEKADALDLFDEAIRDGSSAELLDVIGKEDIGTLKKFATNFLPTLSKVNQDIFYEATIPLINTVIRNLYNSGIKNKDNNQAAAAKILAHFLHDSYDIPENEKKADPELESERKKLEKERNEHEYTKAMEFEDGVNNRTRRIFAKRIEDGLDPNGTLSEFMRSKIIDEVMDKVGNELLNDRQHVLMMNKLWKASLNERFSQKSADRIISAFLSRAKQLIPEIRNKVKNEALGSKKSNNNGERRTTTRDISTGTRTSRDTSGKISNNPKEINWRKVSDRDILNS